MGNHISDARGKKVSIYCLLALPHELQHVVCTSSASAALFAYKADV